MAATRSGRASARSAPAAAARSVNRATPSLAGRPGRATTRSNATASLTLLVSRIVRPGQRASSRSASTATAVARCSQLSRTSSVTWSRTAATIASAGLRLLVGVASQAAATASSRSAVVAIGTRSTQRTPLPKRDAWAAAAAMASLVLPTPPGPVTVTSRAPAMATASVSRSPARPTNEVSGIGGAVPRPPASERCSAASRTRVRWSGIASLRRSAATWLSTVRTEMKSRWPISAWVRFAPSRFRTFALTFRHRPHVHAASVARRPGPAP